VGVMPKLAPELNAVDVSQGEGDDIVADLYAVHGCGHGSRKLCKSSAGSSHAGTVLVKGSDKAVGKKQRYAATDVQRSFPQLYPKKSIHSRSGGHIEL